MKFEMKTLWLALGVLLVLPLLAGSAAAGSRDIDETRKVDADASIDVSNLAGTITVVGWDRDEVKITGSLDEKALGLEIEGDEDALVIKVKYPKKIKGGVKKGTVLDLKVPRGCDLELAGVSTDIEVGEFRGELEIQTVSGGVDVRDDPAEIEIESVSGQIYVLSGTDRVEASNVSGRIVIKGVGKSLEVSTVSGDVDVEADELTEFSFNAVSGDLDLKAAPARGADWEIDCHSGDVSLRLPSDLSAVFDIELFSGDVRNDFGPKAQRTSKYGPGKELHFTVGGGSAGIEIAMFSGEVRLIEN